MAKRRGVAERRTLATEFELRKAADGRRVIGGYALKWRTLSQDLGGFVEEVAEKATSKTLKEDDIRALLNHDPNLVLGRNRSGTLRLSEDSTGLEYEIDQPDTTYARDLMVIMERGDLTQSSFCFRAIQDDWSLTEQEYPLRTLTQIQLYDVSPVTYPAYLDTESGARDAVRHLAEVRGLDPEALASGAIDLRDAIAGVTEPAETTPDPEVEALRRGLLARARTASPSF